MVRDQLTEQLKEMSHEWSDGHGHQGHRPGTPGSGPPDMSPANQLILAAMSAERGRRPLPNAAESGGATLAADVEGLLTPGTGPSTSAFSTSSEEVLTAFNFSRSDDSAFGYEQEPRVTPRIILVCGDLLRTVCRNTNTLASILLEPQNRILLTNFLQDFNGTQLMPWAVGASLKHWARKLSLADDEDSDGPSIALPLLKTTQALTAKGEVNDPGALERLERTVQDYFAQLEAEGPFQQAVQTLGTFLNYVIDSDAETIGRTGMDVGSDVPNGEGVDTVNGQELDQQAYDVILEELRQAEAELDVLQAEADARWVETASLPAENLRLHRIAGFDSFVGLAVPSLSQAQANVTDSGTVLSEQRASQRNLYSSLVFPTRSGLMSSALHTPSKLSTFSDSQLKAEVSLTLLASTSSRHQFDLTTDDTGKSAIEEVPQQSDTAAAEDVPIPSTDVEPIPNVIQEIPAEIVEPEILARALDLERSAIDQDTVYADEALIPTAGQVIDVAEPDAAEISVESVTTPTFTNTSEKSQVVSSKASIVGNTSASSTPRKTSSVPQRQEPKATPIAGKPAVQQRGRPATKPQIAFGLKVRPQVTKGQTPGAKPIKTATHPTVKSAITGPGFKRSPMPSRDALIKVAPGCRRIEFTKVTQTVSYKQLNKENIKMLHQHCTPDSEASANEEKENVSSAVEAVASALESGAAANSERELAQIVNVEQKLNAASREVTTAPQSSANLALGTQTGKFKPFASTPASPMTNSRIPSATKVKSVVTARNKTLGYAAQRQQKKSMLPGSAAPATTLIAQGGKAPPVSAGTPQPSK